MPLTINAPKVLANTQSVEFAHLRIDRDYNGSLSAEACFNLFNENDEPIGAERLTYTGEAFNTFWDAFTTGTFLYTEVYKRIKGEPMVSGDYEEDFVNPTPPEPPAPPPAPQADDGN